MNRVEAVLHLAGSVIKHTIAAFAFFAFVAWVWVDALYANPQPIPGLSYREMYTFVTIVAVVVPALVYEGSEIPDQ